MTDDTPQVKSWTRESIHPTHAEAEQALKALGMKREGNGPPLAKIHLQGRGFVIKVWRGKMQASPKAKPKKQDVITL